MANSRRSGEPASEPPRERWFWLTLRVLATALAIAMLITAEELARDQPNLTYGIQLFSAGLLATALFFRGPRRWRDKVIVAAMGGVVALPTLLFVVLVVLLAENVARG